jgi:hypothetical protein
LADDPWYTLADDARYILAEHPWYIIARLMTKDAAQPQTTLLPGTAPRIKPPLLRSAGVMDALSPPAALPLPL